MTESEIYPRMTADGPVCSGEECPAWKVQIIEIPNDFGVEWKERHGHCTLGGTFPQATCVPMFRRLLTESRAECDRLRHEVDERTEYVKTLEDENDRSGQIIANLMCGQGVVKEMRACLERADRAEAECDRLRHEVAHPADAEEMRKLREERDEYRELIGVCSQHGTLNVVVDTYCEECMEEHMEKHRKKMDDLHSKLKAADKALYAPPPGTDSGDAGTGEEADPEGAEAIRKLREERDAARRELCRISDHHSFSRCFRACRDCDDNDDGEDTCVIHDYAASRGWQYLYAPVSESVPGADAGTGETDEEKK